MTGEEIHVAMQHAGTDQDAQARHVRNKIDEVFTRLSKAESLRDPRAKLEAALQRVAQLRRAHADINRRCKELGSEQQRLRLEISETLIGSPQADVGKSVRRFEAAVAEHRALLNTIEHIAEVATFDAEAAKEICDAELNQEFARLIDEEAANRLRETLALARPVLEHEGTVDLSPKHTVSGLLQASATNLRERAERCRASASEIVKRRDAIASANAASMRRQINGGY